jgi:hypothetical protein
MKLVTWRHAAVVLAVICCYQRWQGCTRAQPTATQPAGHAPLVASQTAPLPLPPPVPPSLDQPAVAPATRSFYGFKVPAWAMRLAPQHGETMRAYRDRVLPLAKLAIAPQRARVARTRDELATLDPRQRAELDAAVQEAATAIQDRVMSAIASGELQPATFKPMTGVAIVRDVLGIVDRGNTRFGNSLTAEQRTGLASHRFDFADYLVFSAPWEDALHMLD